MKAIKRNSENLLKVCDSIVEVNFSEGSFEYKFALDSSICLFSSGRTGIGKAILSKIPSNYSYRVSFEDGGLKLTIWFD